ncbi:amidohydrolase [Mycolicibacterium wolinskyi]|uniref:Amidohydrolase n=1 Tax=Mycolicibacterium wolinskyi TaxID=59750 RepID=A0A1X2F8C2_9MYCO|nr:MULTISPECIES: amidohydrolase family protein [Mycolicibacterium]MCV7286627.1 amidohydrolase [Mycolicibacterium wolinskyi]MCV7293607.1 amidohydrolase [Mycolicibacterium goodii]ORX14665.1 amidohydrolase [Mycolicibacterium wolinskyi]
MNRIDTHHHMLPADYRKALQKAGIDEAGGRALPDWSPEASLQTMAELDIATAVLSVSTPGTTFLPKAADAAALAGDVNDYGAELVASRPDRFGFFATVPMPHVDAAVAEAVRALDQLHADGVVLLANNAGTYLGEDGQDELWAALDARSAVVFVHPAELPGPTVPGIVPFAADFLLDTTRAAYLLVRNGVRRKYPNIKFILSHAGGFVPYASHRMAVAIMGDTGRSPADILDDFASFYFDTALSSSAAALPTLLAFAKPGHITFGSDWPFAPLPASQLFAAGLDTYDGLDVSTRNAINRTNALALLPRLGTASAPTPSSPLDQIRHHATRAVMRGVARLINTK